jgi:hypothetical protein
MLKRTLALLGATLTLLVATSPAATSTANLGAELSQVRRATAHYHDVSRALADGYKLASGCVPQMGFHYLRSVADDASELNPTAPNILVYAPRPDGGLRLVAVEYASWQPASLFGQTFDAPDGGPPFHTLHAWVWQANPRGTFAAANPNVSCDV